MSIRERLAFLAQFRADFEHTGAIQPSSRYLAREMTAPLRAVRRDGKRIVEIGPGTGAVTLAIANAMQSTDQLECYEVNAAFAHYLTDRLRSDPAFAAVVDRVVVHHRPAQELPASPPVDFVVCSAPFNNLDATVTDAIFDAGFEALAAGGTFTFFEYLALPRLKQLLARGAERARLQAATVAKARRLSRYRHRAQAVLLNIPPARVLHVEKSVVRVS